MAPQRMSSGAETFVTEVDGLSVFARRVIATGNTEAAPVIVLHGWGASSEAVGSIVSGLAGSLTVVAVDLPGFGRSGPPPEAWDVSRYAAFVVAACDSWGYRRFSILGHSFGARIGIVLAHSRPERISRLLLTGAAGIRPKRPPAYYAKVGGAKVGRVAAAVGGPPGRRLQARIRRNVASADWLAASEQMRGTFRKVIAEDLTPRLPDLAAPTLLVWGANDEDTPVWMGERMEQLIPDAALIVLPGAGHYAYADRAAHFNRIALHFLSEVS